MFGLAIPAEATTEDLTTMTKLLLNASPFALNVLLAPADKSPASKSAPKSKDKAPKVSKLKPEPKPEEPEGEGEEDTEEDTEEGEENGADEDDGEGELTESEKEAIKSVHHKALEIGETLGADTGLVSAFTGYVKARDEVAVGALTVYLELDRMQKADIIDLTSWPIVGSTRDDVGGNALFDTIIVYERSDKTGKTRGRKSSFYREALRGTPWGKELRKDIEAIAYAASKAPDPSKVHPDYKGQTKQYLDGAKRTAESRENNAIAVLKDAVSLYHQLEAVRELGSFKNADGKVVPYVSASFYKYRDPKTNKMVASKSRYPISIRDNEFVGDEDDRGWDTLSVSAFLRFVPADVPKVLKSKPDLTRYWALMETVKRDSDEDDGDVQGIPLNWPQSDPKSIDHAYVGLSALVSFLSSDKTNEIGMGKGAAAVLKKMQSKDTETADDWIKLVGAIAEWADGLMSKPRGGKGSGTFAGRYEMLAAREADESEEEEGDANVG